MSYEIRPETAKTFITDRSIQLPRFQRKQTWDDKKNFQLCISVFKGYPLGVCILSNEVEKGKPTRRFLLDGRQRRNALMQMYENPENICVWAKKFIGFKPTDDSLQLQDLFYKKINDYLESDEDTINDGNDNETVSLFDSEEFDDEDIADSDYFDDDGKTGIDLLFQIINVMHRKNKHYTGFTAPFDFTEFSENLNYVDLASDSIYTLNGKKLKSFIDEYRTDCYNNNNTDCHDKSLFTEYVISRCSLKSNVPQCESKLRNSIDIKWPEILQRIELIEKLDALMVNCKIGLIEVKGFKSADSQKIFNIINSEGVKLTAVEILSAKSYWNTRINNPSSEMVSATTKLYENMNINVSDVVRWDIPATLLDRLNRNHNIVFKNLSWDSYKKKADFEKNLTLGFKIFSGIYQGGIKKEDIDNMGKNKDIDWNISSQEVIRSLNLMLKVISEIPYFNFMKSWQTTLMDLTSDMIALDFLLISFIDWTSKNEPVGNSIQSRLFQRNCFILWDKLIYEYVNKKWRGSADSIIANRIKDAKDPDKIKILYTPISTETWSKLLDEIKATSTISESDISLALMKPLLYHMYCMECISGPDSEFGIEVDHIIPQASFKTAKTITRNDVIMDNLLNLGLLPKKDNISKSDKKLKQLDDSWLISQVEKYEFIKAEDFEKYSNILNYNEIFEERLKIFKDAYGEKRESLLNG